MLLRYIHFTLFIFIAGVFQGHAQSALPTTWVPGMRLTISSGARGESDTTVIQEGHSYRIHLAGDSSRTMAIRLRKSDLDDLAQVLNKNQLDLITTHPRTMAYDMGNDMITLQWEGKSVTLSTGAKNVLDDKWINQYGGINGYIGKLLRSKMR